MKKILSLIGIFSLTIPLMGSINLTNQIQQNNLYKSATLYNDNSINLNTPSINNFYNPIHPKDTIRVDRETKDGAHAWVKALGTTYDSAKATVSYTINVKNYAANVTDFINYYPQLKIKASMRYVHEYNNRQKDSLPGNWTIDTRNNYPLNENDDELFREDSDTKEFSGTYIFSEWSGNYLTITVEAYSSAWKAGASLLYHGSHTWSSLDTIELISSGNNDRAIPGIKNAFAPTININSYTSTFIDSMEVKNLGTGKEEEKPNYILVSEKIDETLKNALKEDYTTWMNAIKFDKEFNRGGKSLTIKFSDNYGYDFVTQGYFPKEVTMYINLIFNDDYFKKIQTDLSKPFKFNSDTSPNANDESTDTRIGPVISNKDRVEEEVKNRVEKLFINKTWLKYLNYDLSYNNSGTASNVSLRFSDKGTGEFIKNGQWPKEVVMPVEINLTDVYYAGGLLKQLEIKPGKIVEPGSNNPIEDHPSYQLIKEENPNSTNENDKYTYTYIYTYHNSVDLTFTAMPEFQQELKVNGEPVRVLDNIFRTRLTDQRNIVGNTDTDKDNKKPTEPTKYFVEVLGEKDGEFGVQLSFTVMIDAITDRVDFKQWGWNPSETDGIQDHYDQWLLTQEKVKDKNGNLIDNEKYNPLINPETGLINNYVFVKGKDSYPFAQDPLDSNGKFIKSNDPDKEERTNYGYIAQAQTTGRGVQMITPYKLVTDNIHIDNIDHIKRVKLNEKTLEEDGSSHDNNDNIWTSKDLQKDEGQFSSTGLWHYIIYQKNYVEEKLDPKDIQTKTVLPTTGGVIHKLLYIHNDIGEYGEDFLSLNFIKNNERIVPFWNTIQATHLKEYLTDKQISTENIQAAKYENIISYWYDYISDVQSNNIIPKTNNLIDLTKAEAIPDIKINLNDQTLIKKTIRENIKLWVNKIALQVEHEKDYIISDSPSGTKPLANINLEKLADNSKEIQQQDFFVIAAPTSTILTGLKKFTVINDPDFDQVHSFDLNLIRIPSIVQNFSKITIQDLRDVIILQTLNEKLEVELSSANVKANYNDDYLYSLKGIGGVELNQDESLDDELKTFIATERAELRVTVYAASTSNKIQGSTTLTLINSPQATDPVWDKVDIAVIFKKLDLGELFDTNKNGFIDNEEVWSTLITRNSLQARLDLIISQFVFQTEQISDDGQFKTEIYAKETNPNYKGHVTVFFNSTAKINPKTNKTNIQELFINLELGEINDLDGNHLIDDRDIWVPLVQKNRLQIFPHLRMIDFNFRVKQMVDYSYSVIIQAKPDNEYFEGNVTAYFAAHFAVNPDIPGSENDKDAKAGNGFNKVDLAWILPILFLGIGVTSFGIYWMMKRKKSKKVRMK